MKTTVRSILFLFFFLSFQSQAQVLKCNFKDLSLVGAELTISALRGNLPTEVGRTTIDKNGAFEMSRESWPDGYYRLAFNEEEWIDLILVASEPVVDLTFSGANMLETSFINNSTENWLNITWQLDYKRIGREVNRMSAERRRIPNDEQALIRTYEASRDSFWVDEQNILKNLIKQYPQTFFSKVNGAYLMDSFDGYLAANETVADRRSETKIKNEFFDNVDFNDEAFIRSPVLKNLVWRYMNNYIKRNSSTAIFESIDLVMDKAQVNDAMYNYCMEFMAESFNRTGPKVVFQYLVENYLLVDGCMDEMALDDGVKLLANVYNGLLPGNTAPGVNFASYDGQNIHLPTEVGESNVSVLFFWSSHCTFCMSDMPELKNIYQQYEARGLKILGFSVDTDAGAFQKAMEEKDMPWNNYCDLNGWGSPMVDQYKVHRSPYYYLLDSDMNIIDKPNRAVDLNLALGKLFGE